MSKNNYTLFDQLLSKVPSDIKRFVRKQGEIAVQIGTILKAKGITQKQLAKKIGMKESQLSKILAGNANCTLTTITKIENALNEDIITIPIFREEFVPEVTVDAAEKSLLDKKYLQKEDRPLGILKAKASFKMKDDFKITDEELLS